MHNITAIEQTLVNAVLAASRSYSNKFSHTFATQPCQTQQVRKTTQAKMPSTPQMRKANEKNAKNILKRGNVQKSSKSDDKYPVSPELIVSFIKNTQLKIYFFTLSLLGPFRLRGHWLCCLPNHPVRVDGWSIDWKIIASKLLHWKWPSLKPLPLFLYQNLYIALYGLWTL